jgi:hypothetical protein
MDADRETTSRRSKPSQCSFTASERDLIRRKMGVQFSRYPSLADGIFLRTWRGGPQKNEPKIPPTVRTMMMEAGWSRTATRKKGRAPSSPRRLEGA